MDSRTDKLIPLDMLKDLPIEEQGHFIEVKRDLSAKERFNAQIIGLYALCGCGSGKKSKFCCKK